MVKLFPYHAAITRSLAARCRARPSVVDAAHVQELCAVTPICVSAGRLVASASIAYPSTPYVPFQVPWVTPSAARNVTVAPDPVVAPPPPPIRMPLTTALG